MIEVNFPYKTKRSAKDFWYKIPVWLKPSFKKYFDQLHSNSPDSRFLKNWSGGKNGCRKQNYGINKIGGLAKSIALWLGITGNFTAHSFRRSAATSLAEAGISVVSLCHAGRWSSLKTA